MKTHMKPIHYVEGTGPWPDDCWPGDILEYKDGETYRYNSLGEWEKIKERNVFPVIAKTPITTVFKVA